MILRLLPLLVIQLSFATADKQCVVGPDGECLPEESCADKAPECSFWAEQGECNANPQYMFTHCQKSCDACGKDVHQLINEKLGISGQKEKQQSDEREVGDITETPYGVKQESVPTSPQHQDVVRIIQEMENYMEASVFGNATILTTIKNDCRNRHPQCAFWVALGECDANPAYMTLQCAPMCGTCHLLDLTTRCPFPGTDTNALQKEGDLQNLFERLVNEEYYQKYSPQILSMPNPPKESEGATIEGPWVVILDDFLTEEETTRLIELGSDKGYERSMDVGKKKFDGTFEGYVNDRRTSTNAWCQEDVCYKDAITQSVIKKIENITGIDDVYNEFLQLLRYEPGQFYKTHHDYIDNSIDRQSGVRILTIFLYLNDVEEGGGTDFPNLKLTVMPKRGRALIWPSVLDEKPDEKDGRTMHQALPVTKGVKYGANAWVHQRDFKGPAKRGCT